MRKSSPIVALLLLGVIISGCSTKEAIIKKTIIVNTEVDTKELKKEISKMISVSDLDFPDTGDNNE